MAKAYKAEVRNLAPIAPHHSLANDENTSRRIYFQGHYWPLSDCRRMAVWLSLGFGVAEAIHAVKSGGV